MTVSRRVVLALTTVLGLDRHIVVVVMVLLLLRRRLRLVVLLLLLLLTHEAILSIHVPAVLHLSSVRRVMPILIFRLEV